MPLIGWPVNSPDLYPTLLMYGCESEGVPWLAKNEESACNVGDPVLIPGSGRSHGKENGYPLQYSCLENSMDRGVWWATVHGVTMNQTGLKQRTLSLYMMDGKSSNESTGGFGV